VSSIGSTVGDAVVYTIYVPQKAERGKEKFVFRDYRR
jgi:hypothetical protein